MIGDNIYKYYIQLCWRAAFDIPVYSTGQYMFGVNNIANVMPLLYMICEYLFHAVCFMSFTFDFV